MAYNILKGSVEGSVDQHGDQEINGIKIFKNTISASVFYDTDAQSPCATMKDVAIKNVKGGAENSIILLGKNDNATATYNLKYENETLHTTKIVAQSIKASAEQLSNLPADKFIGPIKAEYISHGYGLENIRGELQVKALDGIKCSEDGIGLNLSAHSGLQVLSNKLSVNPSNAIQINSEGQNLSDPDTILVHDVSRNTVTSTSLLNLFNSYINKKVPHAHGAVGSIQFKSHSEFESSDKLFYDKTSDSLNVNGKLNTNHLISKEKTVNEGAVYFNIVKITDTNYQVKHDDYTILCDASANTINVRLPAAKNHNGRVLIIKKTNTDKYKINSNLVYVTCDEGTIDINNRIEIKMNYSSRTLQSDGENWWIVGSKGS